MLLCCCITLNGLPTEIWPILINKWALFSKYMRSSSFYVFCPGWTIPSQTVTYLSNESLKVDIQFLQFCDCVDVEMEEKLSEQTYLKEEKGKNFFSISIKQPSIPSWVMIWPVICGQSYKASTIVIYDSRVVPDWKIPHITTLES